MCRFEKFSVVLKLFSYANNGIFELIASFHPIDASYEEDDKNDEWNC